MLENQGHFKGIHGAEVRLTSEHKLNEPQTMNRKHNNSTEWSLLESTSALTVPISYFLTITLQEKERLQACNGKSSHISH